jgi:malate dehydrogenase (oxaloacetate-decarboxylating)(NADP+)
LLSAVAAVRPTALVGVSTVPKLFNRSAIEAMARINPRPIIFPLSNPTSRSECTAEEAYQWSDGRAVFAAGSPFPPVQYGGKTFVPGQGNNVYVFPAVGLAVYATRARRVTEDMFLAAATALAAQVTPANLELGLVYPPQSELLHSSVRVAAAVAEVIFTQGLAGVERPTDLPAFIGQHVYQPEYRSLV